MKILGSLMTLLSILILGVQKIMKERQMFCEVGK